MKERKKKMEVEVKGDRWRCNLCNLVLGCCEREEEEDGM